MKFNYLILAICLLLAASDSFASDKNRGRKIILDSGETVEFAYFSEESPAQDSSGNRVVVKRPGISFLSSAIIPGAGQYYNGSKKRAAAFLAVEVGLWVGYAAFQGKGRDKEDEYQALADQYWDFTRYNPTEDEQSQGHTIPLDANDNVIKTNEYYENIGKYDKFNRGWEGAIIGSNSTTTEEREVYLNLRKDSNDFFGLATTAASLVILNHILSVGDAIFTAKKLNDEASLKISVKPLPTGKANEFVNALSIGIAW